VIETDVCAPVIASQRRVTRSAMSARNFTAAETKSMLRPFRNRRTKGAAIRLPIEPIRRSGSFCQLPVTHLGALVPGESQALRIGPGRDRGQGSADLQYWAAFGGSLMLG
jgi:hypothetical protein